MTKDQFIKEVDQATDLESIANDTSRTYAERDLARAMEIATLLLIRKDFESAKAILKITLKEL